MPTDPLLPEPGDTGITGRAPDSPAEPEILPVEPVDDDSAFVAGLAEPYDTAPPPPRRRPRPPLPPGPPHPGFWWAVLWCLVLLIVAEFIIGLGVGLVIFFVQAVRLGGVQAALDWLTANPYDPVFAVPIQMAGHIAIFLAALLALRLAAGRSWPRQVAIRMPAASHVLLAVVGAPAFWLLSGGLQLTASRLLPPAGDLPSYVVVAALLMAIVGSCWLLVRLITGHDWVRDLARAPLRVQLVLGPLGLLVLFPLAAQLYRLVSPHIFRVPYFDGDVQSKAIEALLDLPWWAGLLIVAVTPAFSEEFWCRAFLGRGLVGRHGLVMGIFWTSLFFGAIHLFPHQGAMAAVLGIVLFSAYVASRSMLIPMLMHYLNNSLGVLSYKFLGNLSPRLQVVETDPAQIPWLWFAAAGLLAAAVLWAFYTSRARLVRVDGSGEPPWQPPYPGVALPPPGSGTAVVSPWPGVLPTLAVVAGVGGLASALYWF
jgi:membrane protease YdiL (CAAX protease family)